MIEQEPAEKKSTDLIKVYSIYRERVFQEDNLVNHRMQWMLVSNALLFALFGALVGKIGGSTPGSEILERFAAAPLCIIVIGLLCTFSSMFSIHAALSEIEHLKTIYYVFYPQMKSAQEKGLIPSLVGHKHHHFWGKVVPWVIPVAIASLWAGLFLLNFFKLR